MSMDLLSASAQVGEVIITSPAIQGVVASLITTLFMHRGEKIKSLEEVKKQGFQKVTNDLLANGKLSYVEFYKCKNFLKIALLADEAMHDYQSETITFEPFSFDWLMRFFDTVGNVSHEELQQLWGKVLANEVARPKACSLRTLDMIRNMTVEEARTFETLCQYVMQSGDTYYIDSNGFYGEEDGDKECRDYIQRRGFNYEKHIIPLIEAGALSSDHDLATYIAGGVNLEIHNDRLVGVVMGRNDKPEFFSRDAYFLTTSGKELFHVIRKSKSYKPDEEYALLCLRAMKRENPQFYIGAYSVENGGEDLL